MIFVTLGTHNQQFLRLVKAIDEIVPKLGEVVLQTGYTDYKPKNCKAIKFASQKEFEELCKKADVVVTHGGIGSIMTPLMLGKPVVAVPRLKRFGEHTNDHQLQIVKELEKQGKIIGVYDIKSLESAIKKAKDIKTEKLERNTKIQDIVEKFIEAYGG